jgi:glycosyltransferase involved in cell wall biosynthesis
MRTPIPRRYKRRLSGINNVKLIEHPIPWNALEKEWLSSDIFVHPHHGNLSYALIDAMSYGLPIVTTDTWATRDLVENWRTGFLVHDPKAARFSEGPIFHYDNPHYRREIIKGSDPEVVEGLVEKISILIDQPKLRRKMGENAWREVAEGKFSIRERNERLKRILDEVTMR